MRGEVIVKDFKDVEAIIYDKKGNEVCGVYFKTNNQSVFTTHKEYIEKANSFIKKYIENNY